MATLNDTEPAATTDPPAPESAEAAARHLLPVLLAEGITTQEIRELGPQFSAIANAMDAIATGPGPAVDGAR